MNVTRHLLRPWYWFTGKVLGFWARPAVQPDEPATLFAGSDVPVCYVLESGGLADTLALEAQLQMAVMAGDNQKEAAAANIEKRPPVFKDPF